MSCDRRRNPTHHFGFTMVELLVVIAIIAVLAGMLLGAVNLARATARTSFCSNNLRQMGQAMVMYEDSEHSMPLGDLPNSLRAYDGIKRLYVCPDDVNDATDSYTPFYVCRSTQDTRLYVASCHRHSDGTKGPVLYGMGAARTSPVLPVFTKTGDPVAIGEELTSKEVKFVDGSTAKVTGSGSMMIIASFRESDGRVYTIVKIKRDHHCAIVSNVNSGSAYEVVSPSSIASALGTKYTVTAATIADSYATFLSVSEGIVGFAPRSHRSGRDKVTAGNNKSHKLSKNKCPGD